VVKNSFLKRAMADSGMPDVGDKLTGQTAIVMGENDVAPVAKILKMFAAEFKIATLKIGVVDKAVLSTSDVEALAELPAREILLAQLLGLLLAPATRLVRVLNEPASAFARLLAAKAEKGEAAPAPEAKKEEAPAAPAAEAPATPAAEAPAAEAKQEEAPEKAAPEASAAETAPAAPATEAAEAPETPAAEAAPATESTTGETKPESAS
jgi:large subunit ribosomal protein L10